MNKMYVFFVNKNTNKYTMRSYFLVYASDLYMWVRLCPIGVYPSGFISRRVISECFSSGVWPFSRVYRHMSPVRSTTVVHRYAVAGVSMDLESVMQYHS